MSIISQFSMLSSGTAPDLHPILAKEESTPHIYPSQKKNPTGRGFLMDLRGFEPLTSSVRFRNSDCPLYPLHKYGKIISIKPLHVALIISNKSVFSMPCYPGCTWVAP
jgi:hypothetical protein